MVWVNVAGLGDVEILRAVATIFGVHHLALEDVVHVHQRPKVEVYGEHIFVVLRVLSGDGMISKTEQLSLFLGARFVLTFQERIDDALEPIRRRLRKIGPRMHGKGPDYLAYAIIDTVVDSYFPVLETLGERMEEIEDEVILSPVAGTAREVHCLSRSLLELRRAIWPTRDAINTLIREPYSVLSDSTRLYLRDCADHAARAIDLIETYRELGSNLMSLYQSMVSNRMNEVMKVLTIIATIFIPLSFVAGVYGMNFDPEASRWNMPELTWTWGYPAVLSLMLVMALGMLLFFKRRGWLGFRSPPPGGGGDPPGGSTTS